MPCPPGAAITGCALLGAASVWMGGELRCLPTWHDTHRMSAPVQHWLLCCRRASVHTSGLLEAGDCTRPPDACLYPAIARCGEHSRCVEGVCKPLQADRCTDLDCGARAQCNHGACVCESGFSGGDCADVDECLRRALFSNL